VLSIILSLLVIPLLIGFCLLLFLQSRLLAVCCLVIAALFVLYVVLDYREGLTACHSGAEIYPGDMLDTSAETQCREFAKAHRSDIITIQTGPALYFVTEPFEHVDVLKVWGFGLNLKFPEGNGRDAYLG
jgi:hypothetical protein